MTSKEDRARGMGDEAKGNIEKGIGKMTGDRGQEMRGHADVAKGKTEQAMGDAKEKLHEKTR